MTDIRDNAEDQCCEISETDKKQKWSIRNLFKTCAKCTGPAAGGAVLSHIGCVLVPIFASVSGAATGAVMHTAMYVASPVIAVGVTLGIDKLRGENVLSRQGAKKAGISATLALAITFGISALTGGHEHHADGHDHHNHHNHHSQHDHHAQHEESDDSVMIWYQNLPEDYQRSIAQSAKALDMELTEYLSTTMCGVGNSGRDSAQSRQMTIK